LQLFKWKGKNREDNSALWFVGGLEGAAKADSFILHLFQKAVTKGIFGPHPDLFLTPVGHPLSSDRKYNPGNGKPTDPALKGFPDSTDGSLPADACIENFTLSRWALHALPKALVTFSNGTSKIRYRNVGEDVVSKLSELAERPAYPFGEEPEERADDGSLIPRQSIEHTLGAWLALKDVLWIDFSLSATLKNLDEVAVGEWKSFIGPALKWLVEGLRFAPLKEDEFLPKLEVIPALEMPPEFANL